MTQLEFIDAVARETLVDGVVLDDRHFPRTDGDYLAQIKKMAADLGLTIAALASDAFFVADEDTMHAALDRALALGAPLLAGRLGAETAFSWSEQLHRLTSASSLAKSANVTLAVRNAPGTFAATEHDCKRVSKETDSAWLRFGLDAGAFGAATDIAPLREKTVLLWIARQSSSLDPLWLGFHGFAVIDRDAGDLTFEEIQILNRT
ncbi:MAG TPA: TIM barrel protein [Candidatus Aquilonibacter sp.]